MSFLSLMIFNPVTFFLLDQCLHSSFFTLTLILAITTAILTIYHLALFLASVLISLCQLASHSLLLVHRMLRTPSSHADSLSHHVDTVHGTPAHLADTGPLNPVQRATANQTDTGPVDPVQGATANQADTGPVDPVQGASANQADNGPVDLVQGESAKLDDIGPVDLVHNETANEADKGPVDQADHMDPEDLVRESVVEPVHHELVVREEGKEVGERRRRKSRRRKILKWIRKTYLCEYGFEHE